jgi:translation initiation factor 6 (eIF-6)
MIELEGLSKREFIKKMILLSTNLTEEEVDAISMKEGTEIQNLINEINGFGNFQNPDKKE